MAEAGEKDFEIQGYGFDAEPEETRPNRVVRVGLIQNKIILPTDAPILQQVILPKILRDHPSKTTTKIGRSFDHV